MTIAKHNYVSFMVRLWQEESDERGWLIQVEQIPSGEKEHLSSLEALFAFIRQTMEITKSQNYREETKK